MSRQNTRVDRNSETALGETVVGASRPPRFVDVEGCLNFRDLGGYPADGGRSVARSLLYRSDALHRLTSRGAEAFQALEVKTAIDLRTSDELAGRPWSAPIQWKGSRRHIPLHPRNPDWSGRTPDELASPEFALNHYLQTFLEGTPAIKSVVDALAGEDALPAVFYCAAGKDRTGIVAAVILRLLDVPSETVADDYALSEQATARRVALLEAGGSPEEQAAWARVPDALKQSSRATMLAFLASIDDRFGSITEWASAAGITDRTIERLRATALV